MQRRVAFLGLGNMGGPMAMNLAKVHRVTVFDPHAAALEAAAAKGLSVATTPAAAVDGCDTVVTMLPASRHAKELYLGAEGLLASMSEGSTAIDCSTIDADTSRELSGAAAERGVGFLDAPVSGGTAAAAAASLAFMCGGDTATFDRAKPVLSAMGGNIFHAGPAGSGQVAKACNNMLLAIHMIGTCEALELGARNGLRPETLSEIMLASSGRKCVPE